mmetsp:Transcript_4981/g.18060  ORF Transcript_4981/g.18060 Transcript_4981/m.18060 type:complete len:366 (+) Transcript_4981:178-1275(+)
MDEDLRQALRLAGWDTAGAAFQTFTDSKRPPCGSGGHRHEPQWVVDLSSNRSPAAVDLRHEGTQSRQAEGNASVGPVRAGAAAVIDISTPEKHKSFSTAPENHPALEPQSSGKCLTETCVICFEERAGSLPASIACGHTFCEPCIVQWANQPTGKYPQCPTCRKSFAKISIKGKADIPVKVKKLKRTAEDLDAARLIEECACSVCGSGHDEANLLLCDTQGCGGAAHTFCIGLDRVPEGDWYCATCQSRRQGHTRPVNSRLQTRWSRPSSSRGRAPARPYHGARASQQRQSEAFFNALLSGSRPPSADHSPMRFLVSSPTGQRTIAETLQGFRNRWERESQAPVIDIAEDTIDLDATEIVALDGP